MNIWRLITRIRIGEIGIAAAHAGDQLALESGSDLLVLEAGDNLLLETQTDG